ncbi:MAG: hypothetical protein CL663_08840 [Bacteroidetes bacterium]|nr:hypothetical protein [Bacteroidota bacterium]
MSIITLTTDWGLKDHYVAAVKGKILCLKPDAQIIDISHEIKAFSVEQAAFVLKNCYENFPKGSIHIIGVNTEESEQFAHVVVKANDHFFIGTDNGIFSMIFDDQPEKIIELDIPQDSDFFTFSTRDRFVKAAIHLTEGKPIEDLGTPVDEVSVKMLFKPVTDKNFIKGMVTHIDNYENLITNITQELLKEVGKGRKFSVQIRGENLQKIHQSYTDVPVGEIVVIFGSNGHLEVAINQGNASSLLGMNLNDPIMIEFAD